METLLALVFDSDPAIRSRIAATLSEGGLDPVEAGTAPEALDVFRTRPVAVAVLGEASPGDALYDLLGRGLELRPTAVAAVAEGDGAGRALAAARAGAFDVFARPPVPARLRAFAVRAAAQHRLLEEVVHSRAARDGIHALLVGRSEAIEAVRARIADLAALRGPVLFFGEPGSGRTQAARALLEAGERRIEIVRAGAHDAARRLLDSARDARSGVHLADVHELPASEQGRLARALASGTLAYRLTASTHLHPAGARGEASLHPELRRAFEGAVVEIPPLRSRREDVPLLARAFVERLRRINRLPPIALAPEAIEALAAWSWPGNVRELEDAVETAVVLCPDGTISPRDLSGPLRGGGAPAPGVRARRAFREAKRAMIETFERAYLVDLLERHGGQVTAAASGAGMLRSALQRLLRKHDLRSCDYRGEPGGTRPA